MAAASYYSTMHTDQEVHELPAHVPYPQEQHRYIPSIYSEGPPPYSPGIPAPPTPQQQYPQEKRSPSLPPPQSTPFSYPQQYSSSPSKQPYPSYQPQPKSAQYLQPNPPQYSGASYSQRQQPQPQTYPSQAYPPQGYPLQAYPTQAYPPQGGLDPGGRKPQRPYSADQGYYSDPEPERRRHHHHKHHGKRPRSRDDRASKSGNTNALLGATGGALLGDLIFPGLGTAVVGGLGGWYAGKKVPRA